VGEVFAARTGHHSHRPLHRSSTRHADAPPWIEVLERGTTQRLQRLGLESVDGGRESSKPGRSGSGQFGQPERGRHLQVLVQARAPAVGSGTVRHDPHHRLSLADGAADPHQRQVTVTTIATLE
jgi:hypothetical protein